MSDYLSFIQAKVAAATSWGFDIDPREMNPALKDHTRAMVRWALAGGRRALFAAFGLHKTCAQLEIMRLIGKHRPGIRLITLPLGVRQEFFRDAAMRFTGEHAIALKFIRRCEEVEGDDTIYLTNYESVREEILDVGALNPVAVSLDEAAILRGFGGTKTFREAMAVFAGDDRRDKSQRVQTDGVPFRFVATATPDPNEHIELLAYAAFLGVMDVGQAKTRFFKRNSEKADALTLHPHKEQEFWHWVASWALFVQKPSDLGFSDDGYELPPLEQHQKFKLFRKHSLESVYNFEHDLAIAEHVDRDGWLPSTFMLLQPASWHPDVWTDIARMRTMNTLQAAANREGHLCPLQFDIVERLITQFSMKGELVMDPFAGLGTVPLMAVKLGRRGLGIELNATYWQDSLAYLRAEERKATMPSFFDLLEDAA